MFTVYGVSVSPVRSQGPRRARGEEGRLPGRSDLPRRAGAARLPEDQPARQSARVPPRRPHARGLVGHLCVPRARRPGATALPDRPLRLRARSLVRGVRRRRAPPGRRREDLLPAHRRAALHGTGDGRVGGEERDRQRGAAPVRLPRGRARGRLPRRQRPSRSATSASRASSSTRATPACRPTPGAGRSSRATFARITERPSFAACIAEEKAAFGL